MAKTTFPDHTAVARSFPAELKPKRGKSITCLIEAIMHKQDGTLELKNHMTGESLYFPKDWLDEALRVDAQSRP
jgi:hypothetical protein